jgi:hypothetical protein
MIAAAAGTGKRSDNPSMIREGVNEPQGFLRLDAIDT